MARERAGRGRALSRLFNQPVLCQRHPVSKRVLRPIIAEVAVLVVTLSAGCAGPATMSTRMTRAPMLLGPVTCIGCPPSPPPQYSGPPPIVVPAASTTMAAGGNGMTTTSASNIRPAIGRNIERIVPDPCRTDIRVSRLDAKAYGVFAVFFGMSKVDMVLEAYPTDVPSGVLRAYISPRAGAAAAPWSRASRADRLGAPLMRTPLPLFVPALVALAAAGLSGCAGARVTVSADRARYPISFSGSVRDANGELRLRSSLVKVGDLSADGTRLGFLYSGLTPGSSYDISDAVNTQVDAAHGEAVVYLTVTVSDGCNG